MMRMREIKAHFLHSENCPAPLGYNGPSMYTFFCADTNREGLEGGGVSF